jgi:hypothetical protein
LPLDMRRDMRRSWKWFFIGRMVVLLAFTPEVRTAELAASEHAIVNVEAAIHKSTSRRGPGRPVLVAKPATTVQPTGARLVPPGGSVS